MGVKLGQVTVIRILFHRHLEPIAGFHKGKNDTDHNDNNDKLTYRQISETMGSVADHHSKANIAQNFWFHSAYKSYVYTIVCNSLLS